MLDLTVLTLIDVTRAVVTDGVSIGHPCCSVHDCTVPLRKIHDRFCPEHQDQASICALKKCLRPIEEGFRTCNNADHRAIESRYLERGKSFTALRDRLAKQNLGSTDATRTDELDPLEFDAVRAGEEDKTAAEEEVIAQKEAELLEELDSEAERDKTPQTTESVRPNADSNAKSSAGNRPRYAKLGGTVTHCEQLVVCPCGVVLARATMFGSEGVSGVVVSLLAT